MRCTKCKKRIPSDSKFCPSCGNVISIEQKNKRKGCLIILLIILVISVAISLIGFISSTNSKSKMAEGFSSIQSNLIDITLAKLVGNSIVAGKKIIAYSLESIKSITETASQNLTSLSVPSELQDYLKVSVIWANKIALATTSTKTWKNIANQPGNFPLILDDDQAQTFFQSSIKTIAELKQNGADAIKNKDKEAMRLVATKLLIQKHWLNGILYSTNSDTVSFNLVTPVFASNQDPMKVPDIGPVEDVTCQVCNDPKIKWTAQLRIQYGCDIRCKPQQTTNTQTQQTQTQNTKTEQQTQSEENKNDTNNLSAEDIKKLESYTYKGIPKRAICIGNNVGGVFCVEDAVQSTNEIAASAIGFADGAKVLSVTQWEKEYEEIDDTFSEDGTISEPSYPSVEGGHLEGGMGTISTGEPDKAPVSTKTENLPLSLNGHYTGRTSSCNCQLRGTEKENPCSYQLNYPFSFNVSNNVIQWLETDFVGTITNINSSGDTFYSYNSNDSGGSYKSNFTFHFYETNNGGVAFTGTGASTQYYRSVAIPDLHIPEYIDDTICQYKYTGARTSN